MIQERTQTKIFTEYSQKNNKFTLDNILFPKENAQNDIENTKSHKNMEQKKKHTKTLFTNKTPQTKT